MSQNANLFVKPGEGTSILVGGMLGVYHKVMGEATPSDVAIIEHTLPPGQLGAPPHKHTREDEFSIVLAGELTVEQLGQTVTIGPGGYVVKPREVFHAFWNSGTETVRFIEIIAPGGFVNYFTELHTLIESGGFDAEDPSAAFELAATYGLEFDLSRTAEIMEKHDLQMG